MELGKLSTFGLCVVLTIVLITVLCSSVFIGAVEIPFDTVLRIMIYKMFGIGDVSDKIGRAHV